MECLSPNRKKLREEFKQMLVHWLIGPVDYPLYWFSHLHPKTHKLTTPIRLDHHFDPYWAPIIGPSLFPTPQSSSYNSNIQSRHQANLLNLLNLSIHAYLKTQATLVSQRFAFKLSPQLSNPCPFQNFDLSLSYRRLTNLLTFLVIQ